MNIRFISLEMKIAVLSGVITVGPDQRIDETERVTDEVIATISGGFFHVLDSVKCRYYSQTITAFVRPENIRVLR
jgi:hypothetical protein